MARSKKEEREVRKLTKVGKKTIAVTIGTNTSRRRW